MQPEDDPKERERLYWLNFAASFGGNRMKQHFAEKRDQAMADFLAADPNDVATIARCQAVLNLLGDTDLFPWEGL